MSVGAQPDDRAYLRSIALSAAGYGVTVRPVPLPADCAPETLTDTLRTLSADGAVHGVLLLRPLPAALRAQEILDALDARKDVDGMTTWSLGALVTGAAGFAPCTAEACMELLRAHGIDPAGRRVTVVGRSLVIGRPAALLLTRADATVTLCHRKTPGLAARCRDINPAVVLHPIVGRYEAAGRERFFDAKYDYILDCIDLVSCKLDLIETALARGIPILSALGTGNKLDPSQLQITDISKTYGCPLARVMRKELKARGILHTRVLFSPELPAATEQKETPPPGRRSVPASLTWVPGCGGLMMGGEAVLDLARRAKEEVK